MILLLLADRSKENKYGAILSEYLANTKDIDPIKAHELFTAQRKYEQ